MLKRGALGEFDRFRFLGMEILQNFSYFLFKLSEKEVKLENRLSHVLTRLSHKRATMRQVGHPCEICNLSVFYALPYARER